jgi:hypothetical protein
MFIYLLTVSSVFFCKIKYTPNGNIKMQDNIVLLLIITLLLATAGVGYYLYSKYVSIDAELNYLRESLSQDEDHHKEDNISNDLLNFQEELAEYMNTHSASSDNSDNESSSSESEDIELEFYNNVNTPAVIEEMGEGVQEDQEAVKEEIPEKKPRQYKKKAQE